MLDVDIEWTAETIDNAIDDAKANGQLLTVLLTIVPILGFVAGGLALVFGLFVLRRSDSSGRRSASHASTDDKAATAGA